MSCSRMEKLKVDVRMAEAEGEHRHLSAFIEEDVAPCPALVEMSDNRSVN